MKMQRPLSVTTNLIYDSYFFCVALISYNFNSGASVHQRTIPTERPSLVGEVSANFSG
jgi:hypothetical protein